jgi:RHS repeat-associated protein
MRSDAAARSLIGPRRHLATYNNSTTYFIHADWLGTERARSDVTGVSYETCTSLPFGDWLTCSGGDPSPMHFTGKEHDNETNLDHFGARYYSSLTARWLSPDVLNVTSARLVNPSNTLNKYVYGADNPLRYIDRDGEDITIFFRPSGISPIDFGHVFIAAFNQETGQVGFLDYYPRGTGNGPGQYNQGNMQDRASKSNTFATLTIRTTPEEAQKVLNLIDKLKSGSAPDYAALSNNCTTVCEDVLRDLGLDFGDVLPDAYWADVYRNFAPEALDNPFKDFFVPYKPGVDYGDHRDYGMNFTRLLFELYLNQWNQRNNQPQKLPRACTTIQTANGPEKHCVD